VEGRVGLFKKKPDPFSARNRELNAKIAALEAKIDKLSARQSEAQVSAQPPSPAPTPPQNDARTHLQPRLRSTALPHGPTVTAPPSSPCATPEPVFEEFDQHRLKEPLENVAPEQGDELGVRKTDFRAIWQRLKKNIRGPATSNPKLVNYLAAGSIQGLRPLRYEKRVARNRFIVLVAFLILVIWGIIAVLIRRR
jgi:hypothetical protein